MKLVSYLLIGLCAVLMMQTANARDRSRLMPEPDDYRNKPIAAGNAVWYCAYNGKMLTIDCGIGRLPAQDAQTKPSSIDHQLPTTARRILNSPESFAGRTFSIPLYSPPFEFAYAGLLAEGVMCGARQNCSIIFARNLGQLATLVTEFEGLHLFSNNTSIATGQES